MLRNILINDQKPLPTDALAHHRARVLDAVARVAGRVVVLRDGAAGDDAAVDVEGREGGVELRAADVVVVNVDSLRSEAL